MVKWECRSLFIGPTWPVPGAKAQSIQYLFGRGIPEEQNPPLVGNSISTQVLRNERIYMPKVLTHSESYISSLYTLQGTFQSG